MLEKELWIEKPMEEVVLHYAEIASIVGLDGVVCSPLEAGSVHERCGKNFLHRDPRCPLRRWRRGRPETGHHPG